jgi:hypothetical protein
MAPRVVAHPGTRPTEKVWTPVDTRRIPPAGDPFTAKTPKPDEERLAELEEKLAHELMPDQERMELRDQVLALRRRRAREER